MRRICCVLLLFALLIASTLTAQHRKDDARWISGLKNTPVDQLGSGLPHENFAAWFAALAAPDRIAYRIETCDLLNPGTGATDRVSCVVAYTRPPHPGWREWIQLTFIIGWKPDDERTPAYSFLRGIEGPTNPQMARPDRVFSDLSDLEGIVRSSHPTISARAQAPAHRVQRGAG
jgi:hypothetical protein